MYEFKDRLKYAMNFRNKKAIDIANALNINRGIISQYINGNYKPNQSRLYEIANYLNVNPAWLLGFDVAMEDNTLDVKQNIELDSKHRLDSIIMDKSKELTDEDKQKLINLIDTIFDKESK